MRFIVLGLFSLLYCFSIAQQTIVSGIVTDKKGEPLKSVPNPTRSEISTSAPITQPIP